MLPDTAEISAETMLALAHGCKGIFYETYYTYGDPLADHMEGLVDFPSNGIYPPRPIWYKVKQLAARLNGVLGKTMMKLNYTRDYLMLRKGIHQTGETGNFAGSYLSLQSSTNPCNFHTGFFNHKEYSGNDYYYFLLTNQLTTNPTSVNVTVKPKTTNSGFTNFRFRNIEPQYNFDMTFNGQTTQLFNFPAGEGYLFQVAPVVKYGGKLVYNETVLGGTTLSDNMTIESGATLYLFGNYNANANITVKNGGKIICSGNGKITFGWGKQLFLEGNAQLLGNSSTDKLKLQFNIYGDGVVIKPGSNIFINNCEISGAYQGIANQIGDQSAVNILNTKINAVYCGVSLSGGSGSELQSTPTIQNCNITSTISGIAVSNFSEFLIQNNKLNNCGITVSNIPASYIQGNNINGGASQNIVGIFMNSSGGFIRKDTITNCLNSIQLANSSPDIGGCWIYNNKRHGIYIGSGSIPNLVGYYTTNPPTNFALSGYNKIDANGLQTGSSPVDNDGSEIYLTRANILLSNGCNQISDDRTSTPTMNTQYLISGTLNSGNSINAIYNYWGTKPITSSRFKNLNVTFSPYYNSACLLNGGGEQTLVLKTSKGIIVDSIASAEGEPESFTALQESYSIADNQFATGNVTLAKPLYEQIIAGNYTSEEKLSAYNKLYAIGNLNGEDETYFTSLQTTFEDIANNEADTLIKKVYEQNAIKCDVSKAEYVTAINKFDEIIQQNPNSEEAVYAEIDIITTALNIDTTNSGLGKIGGGKYLVKGTSDYLSKLNDILQSKFGINSEEKVQIIPKEYSLHQNYPNPFNPSTTIKFDLPNDGLVELEIFDILGRRITTLVNGYKSAGSYEHQFDASSLASGVYIYKLQAGEFINSKKMILLK